MAAVYCSETKEVFQQPQSELEGPLHSNRGDFFLRNILEEPGTLRS